MDLFSQSGLVVREIYFGRWPGRAAGLTMQDMIVADRPTSGSSASGAGYVNLPPRA
jgi:hypothetical protein